MIVGEYTQCGKLVSELTKGSHKKVCVRCDMCEKEESDRYTEFRCVIIWREKGRIDCCKPCQARESALKSWENDKENILKKREETWMEIYGETHPHKTREIKDKCEATMLENYGVRHALQSREIKEKQEETMIERFGVAYAAQNEELNKKRKATCLENHGVEVPLRSSVIMKKFQVEEIRKKFRETMLRRYGADHPLKVKEFAQKAFRYGEDHWNWNPDRKEIAEYGEFRSEVDRWTRVSYYDYIDEINPDKLERGNKESYFHLDHKYSVKQSWIDGIRDPKIVSHWKNLWLIPFLENLSKYIKCSITLDEMLSYSNLTRKDIILDESAK